MTRPLALALLLLATPAAAEPRFGAFISGGHLCDMVAGPAYQTTRQQWDARGVRLSYLVDFVSFDRITDATGATTWDHLDQAPGGGE